MRIERNSVAVGRFIFMTLHQGKSALHAREALRMAKAKGWRLRRRPRPS